MTLAKNFAHGIYERISRSLYGTGISKIQFVNSTHRKLIKKFKPEYVEVFGYRMFLDNSDEGGYSITKDTETSEMRFLKDKIKNMTNRTIVDVGANIGFYTLFFASLNMTGKIYAFEPEPKNFEILQKNIIVNNLKNITCYNYAISSRSGLLNLNLSEHMGQHSIGNSGIEVKCVKLDDVVDSAGFIKIDAEGHEIEILKGMSRLLKSDVMIMIEFYYKLLKKFGNPTDLLDHLNKMNFRFIDMRDGFKEVTSEDLLKKYDENSGATDLFCYKDQFA